MLKNSLHSFISERKHYFEVGEPALVEINLRMLVEVSFVTMLIDCFFVLLTPYIVKGWQPTMWHLFMGPVSALFCLGSYVYRKGRKRSKWIVDTACLCFIACVFVLVIEIDAMQYYNQPSSFMQVLLIVAPSLFIFKFYVIYVEIFFFEFIYLGMIIQRKTLMIAEHDCFSSIVGVVVSIFVALIIQRLRVESYNLQERYKHLSMTDGLTGIMNKVNCEHAVRSYLEKREIQEGCALLIMDVDNFKKVNDTRGHSAGDEVLSEIGNALLQTFRSTDMLGRIGGDEFMVLMRNVPKIEIVERKCKIFLEKVSAMSRQFQFELSCSVGAVYQEGAAVTYENFFKAADDTMYEAKVMGKAQFMLRRL